MAYLSNAGVSCLVGGAYCVVGGAYPLMLVSVVWWAGLFGLNNICIKQVLFMLWAGLIG